MFKSELVKGLDVLPGDPVITDANGSELCAVEELSIQDDGDDQMHDAITLRFAND
jgi:hypothetical protein